MYIIAKQLERSRPDADDESFEQFIYAADEWQLCRVRLK